jgi:hypothetical protein
MKTKILPLVLTAALLGPAAFGQKTPDAMVTSYDNLADIVLSVRTMESNLVKSILDGHYRAAKRFFEGGDSGRAAAHMALFAAEGDNAIGGVRKRLLEGGHHYNAEGEEKGIYEPGYVVVTRKAKRLALEASAAMRQASGDGARQAAWKDFDSVAGPLLAGR